MIMTMTTDREVRELVAGLPGIDNEARSRLHDGSFGGYVGGPEAKQVLLNLEATA
jgi:hypothetical protein